MIKLKKMEKKIILIYGPPASGKSKFVNELLEKIEFS